MSEHKPNMRQKQKISSRLSKHKRNKDKSGGMILQPRDVQIILAVYDFRFLTRMQIQKLFFGDNSPFSDEKNKGSGTSQACVRLRKLFDHGYLDRQFFPRYAYGEVDFRSITSKIYGSSPAVYCLHKNGAEVVANARGISVREVGWSIKKNSVRPATLEHQLLINDLHITLLLCANKNQDQELETWLSDKECYHKYSVSNHQTSKTEKKVFSPDAFFRYRVGHGYISCFLEVDLATESVSKRFREKIQNYKAYTKVGKYQKKYGQKRFRVLVITTTKARIDNLKRVIEQEGAESVFWFTSKQNVNHQADFLNNPIFYKALQLNCLPFLEENYFENTP